MHPNQVFQHPVDSYDKSTAVSPDTPASSTPASTLPLPTTSAAPVPKRPEFQCHHIDCQRRFARKTSLTNHLKAHQNVRSRSIYRTKRARLRAAAAHHAATLAEAHGTPSVITQNLQPQPSRPRHLPVFPQPTAVDSSRNDPLHGALFEMEKQNQLTRRNSVVSEGDNTATTRGEGIGTMDNASGSVHNGGGRDGSQTSPVSTTDSHHTHPVPTITEGDVLQDASFGGHLLLTKTFEEVWHVHVPSTPVHPLQYRPLEARESCDLATDAAFVLQDDDKAETPDEMLGENELLSSFEFLNDLAFH